MKIGKAVTMNVEAESFSAGRDLKTGILKFIDAHRVKGGDIGEYRYSKSVQIPTLYSSTYAAMTRALFGDLDDLPDRDRKAWVSYLNRHQDADGLYRDPVIYDQGWYKGDPMWCGRTHLTCHVLTALTCLGGIAARPIALVGEFSTPGVLEKWLGERDWGMQVGLTGNEIMNVGILLQYARDSHGDTRAGAAVSRLLDWLTTHEINPTTGLWGRLDLTDPTQRSHAVQAAYHWWTLFFYDRRPIPYIERAIDTLLSTQNSRGGFGWGVHNSRNPFNSSACEDIDSIDPLVRMSLQTTYRRSDVQAALKRARAWVMKNRMDDGGFVFILDSPFQYGHPAMAGEPNVGAMFPTWFRTLSLAIAGQGSAGEESEPEAGQWRFVRAPGFQFYP